MRTDQLIGSLSEDAATPPVRLTRAFALATVVAIAAAAIVFAVKLGPRPDFMEALWTVRFPFKFVVTIAFATAAASLALRLSRPAAAVAPALIALAIAIAVLAVGIAAELMVTPEAAWARRLIGSNAVACLINVPLLSVLPLAALLLALRRGAPSSPGRAGGAAGLLAGALGATFYAAQCPDDSPLFVALWYTIAVGTVTLAGALLGRRALRW